MTLPNPSLYADFTTGLYISGGIQYSDFASWLTGAAGTFTRASTGYSINSSGNLTLAASGVLRLDYDPILLTSKGALLEGASTNLILQSNTFSDAVWTPTGTATVQNVVGPDAIANSAWTCTDTAANTNHWLLQSPTYVNATSYTLSCYVKHTNHQFVAMRQFDTSVFPWATYDLVNGTVTNTQAGATATITQLANGWFRITHTMTATASGVGNILIAFSDSSSYNGGSYAGTGSDTFLVFGAQFEAIAVPTSYIPTVGSSVLRAADNLSFPGTAFNLAASTIFADTSLGIDIQPFQTGIFGATNNDGFNSFLTNFGRGNGPRFSLNSNNISQIDSEPNGAGANPLYPTHLKVGMSYGGTSWNLATSKPATASGTLSIDPAAINEIGLLGIDVASQADTGSVNFYTVGYWQTAFTAAQLQTLINGPITFDLRPTNLTNKAGRYFSRRDYAEWLARIVGEDKATRAEYERFVREAEEERSLSDKDRAQRDFSALEQELTRHEAAVFKNLTSSNHNKLVEAKERRDKARKERDHHYFMEVVKKAWADYDSK